MGLTTRPRRTRSDTDTAGEIMMRRELGGDTTAPSGGCAERYGGRWRGIRCPGGLVCTRPWIRLGVDAGSQTRAGTSRNGYLTSDIATLSCAGSTIMMIDVTWHQDLWWRIYNHGLSGLCYICRDPEFSAGWLSIPKLPIAEMLRDFGISGIKIPVISILPKINIGISITGLSSNILSLVTSLTSLSDS